MMDITTKYTDFFLYCGHIVQIARSILQQIYFTQVNNGSWKIYEKHLTIPQFIPYKPVLYPYVSMYNNDKTDAKHNLYHLSTVKCILKKLLQIVYCKWLIGRISAFYILYIDRTLAKSCLQSTNSDRRWEQAWNVRRT